MLSKTCLNFISDMEVTDHRHSMIDNIESKIENLQLQKCSLKIGPFGTQLFHQKRIGNRETVPSGLCYIKDLTFLENKIV